MAVTIEDIEARLCAIHTKGASAKGASAKGARAKGARAKGATISPVLIAALVELLASLVSNCLKSRKPEEVLPYARKRPLRTRLLFAKALRDFGIQDEDKQAALATLEAGLAEATDEHVAVIAAGMEE